MHCNSETLKKIDFGSLDGATDPNLRKYFYNDNYWQNIVENNHFFVIGRKGTGKSAIYRWIEGESQDNGALCVNLGFKEFPFQRLLSLTDDNFSLPNQYQSIWRYMILTELAKLIAMDGNITINDYSKELVSYITQVFGTTAADMHKKVAEMAEKSGTNISMPKFPINLTNESTYTNKLETQPYDNINNINRRLQDVIVSYLRCYQGTSLFLVQFDQLDDNYNSYTDKDKYFQSIISLFKVIYNLNQDFIRNELPAKIIAYIRSDIFYKIDQYDAESARWEEYRTNLDWSIVDADDHRRGKLRKLLNKRISASVTIDGDPWDCVFNREKLRLKVGNDFQYDLFKYVINRSFHRPRDIVQFCKKMQLAAIDHEPIDFNTIRKAEREYSLWLLQEITNELSNEIYNIKPLFDFLRRLGPNPMSITDFKNQYKKTDMQHKDSDMLAILYRTGIVLNVQILQQGNRKNKRYFSSIRNERSSLNPDLMIELHKGLWKGLYVQTFG